MKKHSYFKVFLFFSFFFLGIVIPVSAEIKLIDSEKYTFGLNPYFKTEVVTLKNVIGLDSRRKDDSVAYIGIDYYLDFNLEFKNKGPKGFLKLERKGPYDYDAPVAFLHNKLNTYVGPVGKYKNLELLPQLKEFWGDTPLFDLPVRFKAGLFSYYVGSGLGLDGKYQDYALSFYHDSENVKWNFYYCKPDLIHKRTLGPRVPQEKDQGILYVANKANFFATDLKFNAGKSSFQPYTGMLLDYSGNRTNYFVTPTHKDQLGTFGLAWDFEWDKLSLGVETARNFGKAKTSDDTYKDVEHCGYMVFAKAGYKLNSFQPHSRFTYASGNKVTTEMVDAGDTVLTSGKNRAFSVYSPLNANLADAIYPYPSYMPYVACGNGYGLNYGVQRPTTFNDPYLLDNLMLFNFGFDYALFNEKFTITFDWWYLRSPQRGVGSFEGISKQLSRDLGNELDLTLNYKINDHITLGLLSGYFIPGNFYKEDRDDSDGSLFTPFVRGDGEADGAYQIEASIAFSF